MSMLWTILVARAPMTAAALALIAGSAQPPPEEAPAQPPAEQRITTPAQEFPPIVVKSGAKPVPQGEFASAEDLLKALEDADRGMRSLTADIVYDKTIATVDARETRSGKLFFRSQGQDRRFAIEFYTFVRSDGTVDDAPRSYVFDGQWLLDKNTREKRFTKKQVVPPGEKFDPLRIGEGPFPIPIGQKRDDILARYTAELLPAEEGVAEKQLPLVKGSYQLRLVPRADRPDLDKFEEIRLWYRADPKKEDGRLLPRMARTVARSPEPGEEGDVSVVRLINVKLNEAISPIVLDTSTPPASEGWDGTVMDFRQAAGR